MLPLVSHIMISQTKTVEEEMERRRNSDLHHLTEQEFRDSTYAVIARLERALTQVSEYLNAMGKDIRAIRERADAVERSESDVF